MEINKLGSTNKIKESSQPRRTKIADTGLKEDTFKKEEEIFNSDEASKFLSNIQNKSGYKKFACEQFITKVVDNVSKEPKKWSYVKQLATRDNISPYSLANYFSTETVENLKKATELALIDDRSGKPKLDDYTIEKVVKETEDTKLFDNVKVLASTELHPENILKITKEKNLDCNKIAKNVNEMTDLAIDDFSRVIFARDRYSKGDYKINVIKSNGSEINALFDSNMNRYAFETVDFYKSKNNSYKIQKSIDYRNNTVSKVRYAVNDIGDETPTHEIRIVKDKNGKVKRTEYTEPSEIKGVMNVKYRYPDGKEEIISSGTIDKKTGIATIRKNMLSALGTRTEYLFEDDPQGNRISDYKITDKNGNVLLKNSETFEVINENKFISSKNDKKYEITSDDNNITVKDLSNPERTATFKRGVEIVGEQNEIINVLKKMPGEELLKLKESVDELDGTKDVLSSYSSPGPDKRKIRSGDNLFAILHELGHSVDMKDVDLNNLHKTVKNAIFEDEKFNKIYEKEKAAFNKEFPDAQRNHIAYFIDHETHYNGERGGKRETIAESNALLTTAKSHELLAMRSQYLQQHFPETIAYLNDKLNGEK